MKRLFLSLILPMNLLAQDTATLFAEAERAYIRGERDAAREKFELVRKLAPDHRAATAYLRRIAAEDARDMATRPPGAATKAALDSLLLPKVRFEETTLPEALEFLRQKGNEVGKGRVAINFVLPPEENVRSARITLNLSDVPFTEVLRYIGELAGVTFQYDRFAIVVRPKTAAQAPAPVDASPKIPGL